MAPVFPELPPAPPTQRPTRHATPIWLEPPRDELPIALPIVRRLGRADLAAIGWLWPTPPSGPLTLHVETALAGIPETATTIDLALDGVADGVLDVWPR